jgi:hypothetical protein
MIDDQDSRIIYSGSWGDWTSDSTNYSGTIKYLQNPTGTETASLTFNGTGIEVIVCTNSDRGMYEVVIDGTSYGKVDTYASSTGRQTVIYSKTDLSSGEHTIVLKAINERCSSASGTKVELDAFRVLKASALPKIPEGEQGLVLASETNRVMLMWDGADDATSYNIYVGDELVGTATDNYAWIENLEAGKPYAFVVKAVSNGAERTISELKTSTIEAQEEVTEGVEPAKVTGLKAYKGDSDSSAKLVWDASENAVSYEVYVDGTLVIETENTSCTLTNLSDDSSHRIMVVAVGQGKVRSDKTVLNMKLAGLEEEPADNSHGNAGSSQTEGSGNGQNTNQTGGTGGSQTGSTEKTSGSQTTLKVGETQDKGNFSYKVITDSTVEVVKLKNTKLTSVKIGNSVVLNGKTYKVTSVAANLFKNNKTVKKVTVGKNVTKIGNNAFSGCTSLKSVSINGKKLTSIGKKAFNGCKNLTSIKIKSTSLKTVGAKAFKGISKKAVIKVPAAKLKAYQKLLAKKGQSSSVVIKK